MGQGIFDKLKKNNMILLFACFLSVMVVLLVYGTGGTNKVYSHLMYIAIAIVSSVYGKKYGVIHAIVCGLMVGPFMPLDVSAHIAQKPINWIIRFLIFVSVSFIIGFFSDYSRLHREQITNLLTHDSNTGLKNIESIKREYDSNRYEKTIVTLTVNGFSETMGFFGYVFSNLITEKIAQKLSEMLKNYSNVQLYQYTGMKFLMKITEIPNSASSKEIITSVEALNKSLLTINEIPIYLEVQMGIAHISGDTAIFDGIRQAMIAYNYAKTNNLKSCIFESYIESYYKDILDIAGGFSNALMGNNIQAAYQEIYDAKTEEIHCVEMLARWRREDGTNIRPDLFVPVIEKTELIQELTRFMIDRAVEFLLKNKDGVSFASINFSIKDFSEEILEYLFQKIRKANISPDSIQIEVTERTLADVKDLDKYLTLLRGNHIKIALDDFGTGYSSYRYLSELPIDSIKIDKSIISKMDSNNTSKSLVKSIVDFCLDNNIKTVAEGIETKEIVDACKEIGIDYLQGYYYHKPVLM